MQDCTIDCGGYTKDLTRVTRDLRSVLILDNSPGAYRRFPGTPSLPLLYCSLSCTDNAIPINSWFSDQFDTALLDLLPLLNALRFTEDVRSVLGTNHQLKTAY